jgi:hypothetical protein
MVKKESRIRQLRRQVEELRAQVEPKVPKREYITKQEISRLQSAQTRLSSEIKRLKTPELKREKKAIKEKVADILGTARQKYYRQQAQIRAGVIPPPEEYERQRAEERFPWTGRHEKGGVPVRLKKLGIKEAPLSPRSKALREFEKKAEEQRLIQELRKAYGTPEQKIREQRRTQREKYLGRQVKYGKRLTGKAGAWTERFLGKAQSRGGFTRGLYQRQGLLPPSGLYPGIMIRREKGEGYSGGYSGRRTIPGTRTGRVGRPYRSYAPQYAAYGGVYGYRKAMSQQRRMERMQMERDMTLTPQQQMLLRQQAMQQQAARMNPENQIIPDTTGYIPMGGYMREISNATKAVNWNSYNNEINNATRFNEIDNAGSVPTKGVNWKAYKQEIDNAIHFNEID